MEANHLKSLWDSAKESVGENLIYRRISRECLPDLFIGINQFSQRFLLLEIPKNLHLKFKDQERQHIGFRYIPEDHSLGITLYDDFFVEIFDEYIISLYNKIHLDSTPEIYVQKFVSHFNFWASFFATKSCELLSKEVIKGLYGELWYLRNLINSSAHEIQIFVNSWRGPYGDCFDFRLENCDVEVKTIDHTRNRIHISNEYQLQPVENKKTELVVLRVVEDALDGINIGLLINDIRASMLSAGVDETVFLLALNELGINSTNLNQYDDLKFRAVNATRFDCSDQDFPRIFSGHIPEGICDVKYSIRLNSIEKFKIKCDSF